MNAPMLLPLGLLGAVLGMDTVTFPQAMLSRPLISATLGGALAGSPLSGLLVGAALELIALETLPFGASRYPEWGSASAVAGAIFASAPSHPPGAMAVAMTAGLLTAWFGGWTMVKLRQLNARWAADSRAALDAGARGTVIGLQLRGITADLLRGFVLSIVSWLVFSGLTRMALSRWHVDAQVSRAITVGVATAVAAAAGWKLFHGSILARWLFGAGLGIGALMVTAR
jgi:mannose/fructose/N-acetylgalactosamine-specific phosphotransferase system component IIC